MVQAGHLHVGIAELISVCHGAAIEQPHIDGVRQQGLLQRLVVGHRCGSPEPVRHVLGDLALNGGQVIGPVHQVLGSIDLGHGQVILLAALLDMEAHRHSEDRSAMLNRHYPPGRETPPVTDAVDLVQNRHCRVTRS